MLPHADFPWLTDALGVLLDHNLVSLAGEERRIVISAPVRAYALMRWRARVADKGVAGRLLESLYRALSRRLEALANDLESEGGATAMLAILAAEANLLATFEVQAFELSSEALESIGRMFECDARASNIHTNELAGKFREISAEMAALHSKMQVDLLRQ